MHSLYNSLFSNILICTVSPRLRAWEQTWFSNTSLLFTNHISDYYLNHNIYTLRLPKFSSQVKYAIGSIPLIHKHLHFILRFRRIIRIQRVFYLLLFPLYPSSSFHSHFTCTSFINPHMLKYVVQPNWNPTLLPPVPSLHTQTFAYARTHYIYIYTETVEYSPNRG